MPGTIRRELRVAFSKNAQPIWFRVTKWTVFLTGFTLLWRTSHLWFWIVFAIALLAGVTLHGIWRHQTHGWTRPWGGWHDIEAAQR